MLCSLHSLLKVFFPVRLYNIETLVLIKNFIVLRTQSVKSKPPTWDKYRICRHTQTNNICQKESQSKLTFLCSSLHRAESKQRTQNCI